MAVGKWRSTTPGDPPFSIDPSPPKVQLLFKSHLLGRTSEFADSIQTQNPVKEILLDVESNLLLKAGKIEFLQEAS